MLIYPHNKRGKRGGWIGGDSFAPKKIMLPEVMERGDYVCLDVVDKGNYYYAKKKVKVTACAEKFWDGWLDQPRRIMVNDEIIHLPDGSRDEIRQINATIFVADEGCNYWNRTQNFMKIVSTKPGDTIEILENEPEYVVVTGEKPNAGDFWTNFIPGEIEYPCKCQIVSKSKNGRLTVKLPNGKYGDTKSHTFE